MTSSVGELKIEMRQPRQGHLARAVSRLVRKKLAIVAMTLLLGLYAGGVFAAWVSPYDYSYQDYSVIRNPPSLEHWAGTDRAGRDVLTRLLWGIQNTIILTFIAMITGGLLIGVTLGLIAGYFGGRVDVLVNRIGEIFASLPTFFLMVIIAATLRPRVLEMVRWIEDNTALNGLVQSGIVDYFVISLALVSFSWFGMARVVRGQVLYLKTTEFIQSAKAIGATTPRILFHHLLPNAISPIIVLVSMSMGTMAGSEILLSWLGLGIQPPRPSLGRMLLESGNIGTLQNEPWMLLAPGLIVLLLIVSWNLLGDALNDVLNPRTR